MARFIVLDDMQNKVLGTIDGTSRSAVYERIREGRSPEFAKYQCGFTIIEITPINGEEALVCDKNGQITRVSMAYTHWLGRIKVPGIAPPSDGTSAVIAPVTSVAVTAVAVPTIATIAVTTVSASVPSEVKTTIPDVPLVTTRPRGRPRKQ